MKTKDFTCGKVSVILAITFLFFSSCDKFEYNPYQTDNQEKPENLNSKNITRLLELEAGSDDTVTIIFSGDSQRYYRQLEALVNKANTIPNADFFILAGDISDFALLQEFLWVNEKLQKLHVPYICAIGNHDLTANGSAIYEGMFGPKNFSFKFKGHKFLFHDTNGREYNFAGNVPDLNWLASELDDESADWFVGVSHVPPYDEDFNRELEFPYKNLFASKPNMRLSLNGHLHNGGDSYHYDDHVRYITSNAVVTDSFLVLKLIDGKIFTQTIYY
jgi:hypothetical protein